MTMTSIDPSAALVIVDLQKGVVTIPVAHPVEVVVANSAALAAAFRARGLPVVLVNATGRAPGRTENSRAAGAPGAPAADWADIVAELDPQPGDLRVTKQTWGAFHNTALDELLRERDVTQVVITGIATTAGVESTARSAYEHGYHVVLAVDAMTDRSIEAHDNSVQRIFPRLGETGTTDEIIGLLDSTVPRPRRR